MLLVVVAADYKTGRSRCWCWWQLLHHTRCCTTAVQQQQWWCWVLCKLVQHQAETKQHCPALSLALSPGHCTGTGTGTGTHTAAHRWLSGDHGGRSCTWLTKVTGSLDTGHWHSWSHGLQGCECEWGVAWTRVWSLLSPGLHHTSLYTAHHATMWTQH